MDEYAHLGEHLGTGGCCWVGDAAKRGEGPLEALLGLRHCAARRHGEETLRVCGACQLRVRYVCGDSSVAHPEIGRMAGIGGGCRDGRGG